VKGRQNVKCKVVRKIIGTEKNEIFGGWKTFYNQELLDTQDT
jgi:hypothetical protein